VDCGWEACEDANGGIGVKGERRAGACVEGLKGVCKDVVGADGRSNGVAAGCSESFGCEL